jgi:NO-binding membrane sensor protein with MHYT domain
MPKQRVILVLLLAVLVSAAIGYVDTHLNGDDNLPSVLIISCAAFVFGVFKPAHAWQWALIIGLGIPVSHLIGLLVGYHPPYPVKPNVLVTFIAFIPAFIGAYLGVLVRTITKLVVAS